MSHWLVYLSTTIHYIVSIELASITKSSFMMVKGVISMEAMVEGSLFLHVLFLLVYPPLVCVFNHCLYIDYLISLSVAVDASNMSVLLILRYIYLSMQCWCFMSGVCMYSNVTCTILGYMLWKHSIVTVCVFISVFSLLFHTTDESIALTKTCNVTIF